MTTLARLFGFRRDRSQWENPKSSIGDWRGPVQNGKYTCWNAVGPVRETWNSRLGPEIKNFIRDSCKYGPLLIVEIYMIGRTEDSAVPRILICSTDPVARKEVRRAILKSGILNEYPLIGLGDTSGLPDHLAQEDIEPTFSSNSTPGEEIIVLSSPLDNAFGRRLFIPRRDGGSLRPATAGPILYINDKIYQLTVGHAFSELDDDALSEMRPSNMDDCDFDGQSDSEDEDSCPEDKGNTVFREMLLDKNCSPIGNHVCAKLHDSSSGPESSSSTAASKTLLPSDVDLSAQSSPASSKQSQKKEPAINRRLNRIGKLALVSETGTKQSLDYALVELEGANRDGSNEVALEPNGTQRWLRVRQVAKIISSDVGIISVTASSGLLSGKLYATASYMRLPNQRTLQELYSVRLNGKLAHGDCGSGVVDQVMGDLYGHIVAGSIGTGIAYIVPAMHVFEDIMNRLGGDVTLLPVEMKHSKRFPADCTGLEPLRLVEFGSKQYFRQLKQPSQSKEDQNNANKSLPITPITATSLILPVDGKMPGTQYERTISPVMGLSQQQDGPRRPRLRHPINGFQSKLLTRQSNAPASNVWSKGKGKEERFVTSIRNQRGATGMTNVLIFEQRFFALPSDLQVQIIAYLRIPDILNLRIVSRNWYNLISLNEMPISRAFLEHNPFPRFATYLYPLPDPSEITLHYICGQWHRFFMASKLSAVITEWITTDIFLRKTEAKRLEFLPQQARMHRRLVPLLFIIFHFFEMYRHLHIKRLLDQGYGLLREAFTTNPIELQIMSMYDNETLLQVHQFFPFLVMALCGKLRPPSYFSRIERSIRGYHQDPPPPHVPAAIFFIGGLREVARFSAIEDYEARRTAVDNWYASISREPINSESQSRRWLVGLGWRQSRQTSLSAAEGNLDNTASVSGSVSSRSGPGDGHDGRTSSSPSGNPVLNASLAAGPPMGPLSAEHTQLLLPDLPVLQQIWLPTAEALLLERRAIERRQDIKKNAQVLLELIREGITDADELFHMQAVCNIIQEDE